MAPIVIKLYMGVNKTKGFFTVAGLINPGKEPEIK